MHWADWALHAVTMMMMRCGAEGDLCLASESPPTRHTASSCVSACLHYIVCICPAAVTSHAVTASPRSPPVRHSKLRCVRYQLERDVGWCHWSYAQAALVTAAVPCGCLQYVLLGSQGILFGIGSPEPWDFLQTGLQLISV